MGMYTELYMNSALKVDTPATIIAILEYMVGDREYVPAVMDTHELFETDRWHFMLRCDSYYFDADTHSTLRMDGIAKTHYLCIQTNLKNYDHEIEKFISWISPHLEKRHGEFLGFKRYEEDNEPTLLYQEELS